MNINLIIFFILCLDVAIQHTRSFKNIAEARVNFFYRINFKIHVITNKLFLSLKFDKHLITSTRFQKLLKIHTIFDIISEKNCGIYKELINVSKANFEKSLDELLQHTVEEAINILENNAMKLVDRSYKSKISSNIAKYNYAAQENFLEIWSTLSDETIKAMIDMIIKNKLLPFTIKLTKNIIQYNKSEDVFSYINKIWSELSDSSSEVVVDAITSDNINPKNTNISDKTTRETQKSIGNFGETLLKLITRTSAIITYTDLKTIVDPNVTKSLDSTSDKQNETIDSIDFLYKGGSKFNDTVIKKNIDPIIREGKDPYTTESLATSEASSQELETWHLQSSENVTRRIYKGRKTKIKNYPFVASLHLMSELLCAGSIISMDMVLTAASCLEIAYKNKPFRSDPRTIFIRVGSDRTKRSGKLIPIVQVIFHPKYDPITLKHNLAIVKMLKKLKHMKKKYVRKIKIDNTADDFSKSVKHVTILGWGARAAKENLDGRQKLTLAYLDTYDINDCKDVYSKYYVTETNFCAGFTYKGGGACIGDVGGPAVVAEELVGVVSFGPTVCGMPDTPTVFTKIGYYAQWINEVINTKAETNSNTEVTMSSHKDPNIFIIPLYTTSSTNPYVHTERAMSHKKNIVRQTSLSVPRTTTEHNRFTNHALLHKSKEIEIFKKFLKEFISGNHSLVDYLSSSEINEDEKEFTKIVRDNDNKMLFDLKYRPTLTHDKVTKSAFNVNEYDSDKNFKLRLAVAKIKIQPSMPQGTSLTGTTSPYSDYDGHPTKLATFVESSEFPEDDLSSYLADTLLSNDSSYYEAEIPIEDTPFPIMSSEENEGIFNKQIDLKTFFEKNPIFTTDNPNVIKSITRAGNFENSLNANHQSNNVKVKNEINVQEVPMYHKSNSEHKNRIDNVHFILNTSSSGDAPRDIIVHFVTATTPSMNIEQTTYNEVTTEHVLEIETYAPPKGKTMSISLEDFNYYDNDHRQNREKNRDVNRHRDYSRK